ncbi:hypothetical protein CCP2SC5_750009 [Azospirillaceae bacterium]
MTFNLELTLSRATVLSSYSNYSKMTHKNYKQMTSEERHFANKESFRFPFMASSGREHNPWYFLCRDRSVRRVGFLLIKHLIFIVHTQAVDMKPTLAV